jgi:hypothetical protein
VVRLIGKLLALFAILIMPLGMQPAAAATHHEMTAATMQHCPEQGGKHDMKGGFADCTMACSAALPAADLPQQDRLLIACAPIAPAAAQMLHGLHPDTATPPPKLS